MIFEWDPQKAAHNVKKHGLSFAEAVLAFRDPLSLTIPDTDHAEDEERWILLGETPFGRLVVVVHMDRGDTIRIISARDATRRERRDYEG